MKLNGWRRLGVFLVALWAIGASATLAAEYFLEKNAIFTYRMLPSGTVFENGKVTMPDGKEYVVSTVDRATGRSLKAWEIDWTLYSEIPQFSVIRWKQFLIAAFMAPLIVWVCVELLTVAVLWITAGFRKSKSAS